MARVTPPTVMPSSSTKRTTADFEFVSEPAARPPFRGVGHQPGIVFPFGKLSTKPIKHMRVRTVAKQLCSSQVCCIEQRTQRRRHRLT